MNDFSFLTMVKRKIYQIQGQKDPWMRTGPCDVTALGEEKRQEGQGIGWLRRPHLGSLSRLQDLEKQSLNFYYYYRVRKVRICSLV